LVCLNVYGHLFKESAFAPKISELFNPELAWPSLLSTLAKTPFPFELEPAPKISLDIKEVNSLPLATGLLVVNLGSDPAIGPISYQGSLCYPIKDSPFSPATV